MNSPEHPVSVEARDAASRDAALRAANSRARRTRSVRLGWIWEWAKVFPAAVLLFLGLRAFLVEAYKIPSGLSLIHI